MWKLFGGLAMADPRSWDGTGGEEREHPQSGPLVQGLEENHNPPPASYGLSQQKSNGNDIVISSAPEASISAKPFPAATTASTRS